MVELKKIGVNRSKPIEKVVFVDDSGLKKLDLINPKDVSNYKSNLENKESNRIYVHKNIIIKKLPVSSKSAHTQKSKKSDSLKSKPDYSQKDITKTDRAEIIKTDQKEIIDTDHKKKLEEIDKKILTPSKIIIDEKISENVDDLLDQLSDRTKDIDQDNSVLLEQISFLDTSPKVNKVIFKDHNVSNLYAKIDLLEKQTKIEEDQLNQDNSGNQQNLENQAEFNQDLKENMPKKKKRSRVIPLIEQFDIPNMLSLTDKTNLNGSLLEKGFFVKDDIKSANDYLKDTNFVKNKDGLKLNPEIDKKIEKIKDDKKKKSEEKKRNEKDITNIIINQKEAYDDLQDMIAKNVVSSKSTQAVANISGNVSENYDSDEISKKKMAITNSTNQKGFDYILPSDSRETDSKELSQKLIRSGIQSKFGSVRTDFDQKAKSFPELVYSTKSKIKQWDNSSVYEKYNIDDLTYVTISYDKEKGLSYNIVQPELTQIQEKTFYEIKKHFLDSIDKNYFSFKGDKENIRKYIKSIFDITVDKLSYNLSNLDKKMYFSFIERDVSGLGFLSNLLNDRNILEVTCAGEKTPITVYHVKYGILQTNLEFENIPKLNLFVLSLTKIMGLHVNSNQPVISGYLPNGYKVEGLYSVGDLSNRGSSFIIKKYLEEPLTPVTLTNLGIGSLDVYAYIWCAIDEGYQIVLTGEEDNFLITNTIAQLYPDKKIITVQSVDNLTLAQKNWIKRIALEDTQVSKKLIINQSISEKPDYLIVDHFIPEFFETPWYNLSMLSIDKKLLDEYVEKSKLININLLVIQLKRIKQSKNQQQTQFSEIKEICKGKEYSVIEFNDSESEFHINLLSSNIDLVSFTKKKKLLRWLIDSKISNYKDFNSIINDYYLDRDKLFEKLGLLEEK